MRRRLRNFSLIGLIILVNILFFSFISAEFDDCWQYANTNESNCESDPACIWSTSATNAWCDQPTGCCMDIGCWLMDGTNQSHCESDHTYSGLNCTWDPFMVMWYPNGTQAPLGGCMSDWFAMGGGWGGVSEGCWQYDGDKSSCAAQGGTCRWLENDQNQEPWCWVKSLSDAQDKNVNATVNDIGCCDTAGCWIHDGNQTNCETSFNGNCWYDTYGGWCNTKWCGEITDEENCTYVQQNLFMPCNWSNPGGAGTCDELGGGGFDFYDSDADSCFDAGGWYNSTGDCVMPEDGGFMFAGEAHCWFADNQLNVCNNITGCAYCEAGSGNNGVLNSSSNNICYNKQAGYCEGHATQDLDVYVNANNSNNLNCTHIQLKAACNYGPLPNCKWTNSSALFGPYCSAGASSEKKSAPPVQYCEDPESKNNYTLCMQLIQNYMMPCKWDNSSYPVKNCTFNDKAVFGVGAEEKDFEIINNQFACTSAGGSWNTEYYLEGEILKQDSWCEMTGFFDIDLGQGMNNKGNCDTSCWACEFMSNGTAWGSASAAQNSCEGSALGYCTWTTDSNAFNGKGWCDFPSEMEDGGAQDCNLECEGCNFMNSPQTACEGSVANNGTGCKWVSEYGSGYCVDKTKKTCSSDCFSCFDETSCYNSSVNCSWETYSGLCSPEGFTGEICFDGIDNDADTLIDCSDPDCGFDNFCGGNVFGGDCFAQIDSATCNNTVAFGSLNCTWLNDTWNTNGWCDMPGANCWKFDDNLTRCGLEPGCTNDSSSMGPINFCDINMTKMNNANCWNSSNENDCLLFSSCQWVNDTWCQENPTEQWCLDNPNAGWCDYKPFADCHNLNESVCSITANCTWNQDPYSMMGGWCDVGCFNHSISSSGECTSDILGGLCEWRDMSQTCQPSTFMIMGGGAGGGKGGCWQYDGNQSGCLTNSITCTYKNDTYSNNNLSVTEPAGWCMDKAEYEHFGEVEGDVIDLAMDPDNIMGAAEAGIEGEIDLLGMGMRVTDEGFNFGAGVYNISEAMLCNGYMVGAGPGQMPTLGTGNDTTKFYWYLDTNGNPNDGCEAVPSSGSNLTGFDFLISYVSRNSTNGVVETKQLMRCSNSNWIPTNALITTSKKLSCGEISGVMVALAKQDIEGFSEYDKTAVMRIYMASADENAYRAGPSDSLGPGYYTPGSIDFGFVDCSDPSMTKDPKCKNFQKFGFNVFEECKNGIDDDENGLIDCLDPFCAFMPDCGGGTGFNFSKNYTDVTAPIVMFSEVEKLYDAAFVRVDTNEPSNLSLTFYSTDSSCNSANLNATLTDTGTGYQENANFKPFHSIDLMLDTLGYALTNGTAYYYKIKVCDASSNCAVSACSNFTTKTSMSDKSFIFKLDLPDGYTVDIPAFNKLDYNFTENFGGALYEVGIKTNTSVTKNMNMTIYCGGNESKTSIGFYGMNVLDPTNIDLSNAFVCDTLNGYIGMNSTLKKWNKLINDLRLGGATDYIEITLPVGYSASNTLNWTNDDATANGQDVDDYVSCTGDSTYTTCQIPVSMGFSAYTIETPAGTPAGDTGGSSGGSGAGTVSFWTKGTITVLPDAFEAGYTQELSVRQRLKLTVNNAAHYVGVISLTENTATINVSSTPQQATFGVEDLRKFDVDDDKVYDISVLLNSINQTSSKVNLTVFSISELVTSETQDEEDEKEKEAQEKKQEDLEGTEEKEKRFSNKKLWISIIAALVVILVAIYLIFIKKWN